MRKIRSKKYEVVKATTNESVTGVDLGHIQHKFDALGRFVVTDPGVAQDIQQAVGQDGTRQVVVIDVPNHDERGVLIFGSMPRGWHDKIDWGREKPND